MNRRALVFFTFAASLCASAADSIDVRAYDIASFQPFRYRYHSLFVSPDAGLLVESRSDTGYNLRSGSSNTDYVDGNLQVYGSHVFRDFSTMSDIDLQTTCSMNGSLRQSRNEGEPQDITISTDFPEAYVSLSNKSRYRRYLPRGIFLEGGLSPAVSFYPSCKREHTDYHGVDYGRDSLSRSLWLYDISKSTEYRDWVSFSGGAHVGIGKGWVADVTAAAVALNMLDRIGELSGARPRLSGAQIDSLARLIDRFRQKRVFDSRMENIETMDTLCRYLVKEKIIAAESARMAMELADIRTYGFEQSRRTGREIKLLPKVEFYYSRSGNTTLIKNVDAVVPEIPSIEPDDPSTWPGSSSSGSSSATSNRMFSYGLNAVGAASRLIGRNLQLEGSLGLTGLMVAQSDSFYSPSEDPTGNTGTYPRALLEANGGCKWYPSLRSTVSLSVTYVFSKDFAYTKQTADGRSVSGQGTRWQGDYLAQGFSTSLDISYFVSPRCTYTIYSGLQVTRGKSRCSRTPFFLNDWRKARAFSFSIGSTLNAAVF